MLTTTALLCITVFYVQLQKCVYFHKYLQKSLFSRVDLVPLSEHNDGRAEDSIGRTSTGKRLSASTEGYDLQREDKGVNREIHTGNGVVEDEESGTYFYVVGTCTIIFAVQCNVRRRAVSVRLSITFVYCIKTGKLILIA